MVLRTGLEDKDQRPYSPVPNFAVLYRVQISQLVIMAVACKAMDNVEGLPEIVDNAKGARLRMQGKPVRNIDQNNDSNFSRTLMYIEGRKRVNHSLGEDEAHE